MKFCWCKITRLLIFCLLVLENAQTYAEELPIAKSDYSNKIKNNIEIGIEVAELKQNDFDSLGSSNYTFFIGQQFQKDQLENWGWRFLSINVELRNKHLRDEKNVCCIDGNRDNLVGELNQQRLYLDYYPSILYKNRVVQFEFIPSFGIGYNYWYTKDTVANEDHGVSAITVGGNFRLKIMLYDFFFIETPNIDIAYTAWKSDTINATVVEATYYIIQ